MMRILTGNDDMAGTILCRGKVLVGLVCEKYFISWWLDPLTFWNGRVEQIYFSVVLGLAEVFPGDNGEKKWFFSGSQISRRISWRKWKKNNFFYFIFHSASWLHSIAKCLAFGWNSAIRLGNHWLPATWKGLKLCNINEKWIKIKYFNS
jgi:hypothetical protein